VHAGPFALPVSKAAWKGLIRSLEPEQEAQPIEAVARAGQVYRICLNPSGEAELEPRSWVQGAAVVIETATGGVVAMVGGIEMPFEGFNRATQALRQPGSGFKPILFAAALEAGKTPESRVLDAPLTLGRGAGRWSPRNYDGRYRGRVSLRTALAQSLNTAAVRLGLEVGIDPVLALSHRLGIRPLNRDASVLLGAGEVSLLELTLAYSAFTRQGVAMEAVFMSRVLDRDGLEVGRAGKGLRLRAEPPHVLPGDRRWQAIEPSHAYELVTMLQDVVAHGTARKAAREGYARAAKTGTSSDFADAWVVGMTPTHTVGVWIGCDQRTPLGLGESGGRAALPAWNAIVTALEGPSPQPFVKPGAEATDHGPELGH